jgi:hypothetical protein
MSYRVALFITGGIVLITNLIVLLRNRNDKEHLKFAVGSMVFACWFLVMGFLAGSK